MEVVIYSPIKFQYPSSKCLTVEVTLAAIKLNGLLSLEYHTLGGYGGVHIGM